MAETLIDSVTAQLLEEDRDKLSITKFPILTLSASFRDIVEEFYNLEDGKNHPDVTFSRAHYSMALAVAVAAWGAQAIESHKQLDWRRAWLVDPTNYVQREDWKKAASMEFAGRLLARNSLLNWIKQNFVDRYARGKLPITAAIQGPLLYLAEPIESPIISMHVEIGNLLAPTGKKIVQVITDPHVREDYLKYAELTNIRYCVFDESTKEEFLEKAELLNKKIKEDKVVVTGPPLDPRVVMLREKKSANAWRRRGVRILLTTGGLGTNKDELEQAMKQLLPITRKRKNGIQLVYYAGTNQDHVHMVREIAKKEKVSIGKSNDPQAHLRILEADDLVMANALLLEFGLPWADLVITKPSGDMAYDAAASGSALLFLQPWGDWERVIRCIFVKRDIAQKVEAKELVEQLERITEPPEPWLSAAIEQALAIPQTELAGAKNILQVAAEMGKK